MHRRGFENLINFPSDNSHGDYMYKPKNTMLTLPPIEDNLAAIILAKIMDDRPTCLCFGNTFEAWICLTGSLRRVKFMCRWWITNQILSLGKSLTTKTTYTRLLVIVQELSVNEMHDMFLQAAPMYVSTGSPIDRKRASAIFEECCKLVETRAVDRIRAYAQM